MIKKIIVQNDYAGGGYSFNILETPCSITYKVKQIESFTLGLDTYWHGYMLASEIKTKKFPVDANPRKPSPTKVVKLMQATLIREPENFHHLNNGITIIAKSLKFNKSNNEIFVEFGPIISNNGDGICNGGHTYFSIDQFQGNLNEIAIVRVEFVVLDPSLDQEKRAGKIKTIAEARNAHNELESITSAHYSGYYDKFIQTLENKSIYFKWFEGDPNCVKNAEKVDSLIARLTSISPFWYPHFLNDENGNSNHISSARNQGSIHNRWLQIAINSLDEKNLNNLLPLLNDVLLLQDEISYSLMHDDFPKVSPKWRRKVIWQHLSEKAPINLNFKVSTSGDSMMGYSLSHAFLTMILGAFRENIWYSMSDDGINYIGWLVDPIKLWQKQKEEYMRSLDNIASTINAPSFGNAFLQNPAIYNFQLAKLEFGSNLLVQVNKPEVIYDSITGEKYIQCQIGMGTSNLEIVSKKETIPVSAILNAGNSSVNTNYKLASE
jgi:hypothetical protein